MNNAEIAEICVYEQFVTITKPSVLQVHVFVRYFVFDAQVIRVFIKTEVKNAAALNIAYVIYHTGRYAQYVSERYRLSD